MHDFIQLIQMYESITNTEHVLHIIKFYRNDNLLLLEKLGGFFWFFYTLFIFGCVGSLLLRVGFHWLSPAGAALCCGAWASHCSGFSCCGTRAPGTRASVVAARGLSSCGSQALEHRLSSCGARA